MSERSINGGADEPRPGGRSGATSGGSGIRRAVAFVAGLLLLGVLIQPRASMAAPIHIDTAVLAAGSSARLDFALFDGDFDLGNNTVTLSDLVTDGTLQVTECSLGCVGGPPFVIDESLGLGQFLQDLVLGTYVEFGLAFTSNFSAGPGIPDLLVLNLLDPATNLTLVDTDLDAPSAAIPYQDAILLLSLTGDGVVQVPTVIRPIGQPPIRVPEPPAVALMMLAFGLLTYQHRRFIALKTGSSSP